MNEPFARRSFLKAVPAAGYALMAGPGARAAAPAARVLETRVISEQPAHYHGWPTLVRRRGGELLLACSGGREAHVCPFGRVELMTSRDGGASWSYPRVLLDGPIDVRDAGLMETGRGTILATTFTSLAYEPVLAKAEKDGGWAPERLARWRAAHRRVDDAGRRADLGVWMIRSTDGGVTWSRRADCLVNSPHGPTQLADGRLPLCRQGPLARGRAGRRLRVGGRRADLAVAGPDPGPRR